MEDIKVVINGNRVDVIEGGMVKKSATGERAWVLSNAERWAKQYGVGVYVEA